MEDTREGNALVKLLLYGLHHGSPRLHASSGPMLTPGLGPVLQLGRVKFCHCRISFAKILPEQLANILPKQEIQMIGRRMPGLQPKSIDVKGSQVILAICDLLV